MHDLAVMGDYSNDKCACIGILFFYLTPVYLSSSTPIAARSSKPKK